LTKLAELIAREEGFFKKGVLPARRHNPGDLRHSPHSSHVGIGPNDIGIIDSNADGWADLERQLQLFASRGMTLEMAIYEFAPAHRELRGPVSGVCAGRIRREEVRCW
jgi:hypothetical protein